MGSASLVVGPPLGSLRPRRPYHHPRPRPLLSLSRCSYSHPDASSHSIGKLENLTTQVQKSSNDVPAEDQLENQLWMTGGAYDFRGATTSLTNELLSSSKKVTLVRHGLSSWNEESRVQGSSNLSILTDTGARQAEKCRNALVGISFDICFSSPISRAKKYGLALFFLAQS